MMRILKYTLVLLLSGVGLTACGSAEDSAAGFISSGKELLADNKPEKARVEFKNAIQIDPKAAEPFYQLALLDEKAKKWKSMYGNLLKVEQLNPKHHDATIKLGQLYLLSGNMEFAMERADKVLADEADNTLAWVLKSSVELKKENYELASKHVEQALNSQPSNVEAISLKAILLNKQAKPQQAIDLLSQTIKEQPDQLALKMIKLSILEEQKDYPAMELMYEKLKEKHASETWVYVSLAKLYQQQGEYLKATAVLEEFVSAQPNNHEAKLLLVSLVQSKEPEKAIKLLSSYIKLDSNDFELRFAKIKLLITTDNKTAAIAELQQIVSLGEPAGSVNKANVMLANFDMQNNDSAAANQKLDKVLANAPEDEAALLTKAKIEVMNKNVDSAVTRLRVVLRNNPESEQALVLLAQAYLLSGSTELAEDNFRQALSLNPGNTVAALSVAQGLMKSKDLNRTETVLMSALERTPGNDAILQTLAQVRLLKKDWSGSQSIVDDLREKDAESAVASYLSARILQGQERYQAAVDEYKHVLAARPSITRALQGLAFSSMKLNQQQELLTFLAEFTAKNPRQFAAYAIQSSIYLRDKSFDKAVSVLQQGIAVEPKWLAGYNAMATVYMRQADVDNAIKSYQQGLSAAPENNALAMRLASLYEQNNKFTEAKTLYEAVLERDASLEPAINNLASLLSDQFRSAENLKKAAELTQLFKTSTEPYFLDTYGWVQTQLGNLAESQLVLERVVSLAPDVAVFNYHLAALYVKQKNLVEAKKYLNIAQQQADQQGDKAISKKVAELLLNNP